MVAAYSRTRASADLKPMWGFILFVADRMMKQLTWEVIQARFAIRNLGVWSPVYTQVAGRYFSTLPDQNYTMRNERTPKMSVWNLVFILQLSKINYLSNTFSPGLFHSPTEPIIQQNDENRTVIDRNSAMWYHSCTRQEEVIMSNAENLQLFEDQLIRTPWNEKEEE